MAQQKIIPKKLNYDCSEKLLNELENHKLCDVIKKIAVIQYHNAVIIGLRETLLPIRWNKYMVHFFKYIKSKMHEDNFSSMIKLVYRVLAMILDELLWLFQQQPHVRDNTRLIKEFIFDHLSEWDESMNAPNGYLFEIGVYGKISYFNVTKNEYIWQWDYNIPLQLIEGDRDDRVDDLIHSLAIPHHEHVQSHLQWIFPVIFRSSLDIQIELIYLWKYKKHLFIGEQQKRIGYQLYQLNNLMDDDLTEEEEAETSDIEIDDNSSYLIYISNV